MILSDCNIFYRGRFRPGRLEIGDGVIVSVECSDGPEADGPYILPGLVDIHTHGCMGYDFSDGDPDGLGIMAGYYAAHGVTSFCPTSMTLPEEDLSAAFAQARIYAEKGPIPGRARLIGINMEGPYLSPEKKGAQNEDYLRLPDTAGFRKLYEDSGRLIRLVSVAPELDGAEDFAREVSAFCHVSAGHTAASYDKAGRIFRAGADHITHLYNAMPSIHHRNPGVIGAAYEDKKVYVELICDGHHVHPAAVRVAFDLFRDRICLISDSVRCAGMPQGEYELGGQRVYLKDGTAVLADGTLAGSAGNLFDDMKNAIRFGIPAEAAVMAATVNPARSVSAEDQAGSIECGRRADILICSREFDLLEVYAGGEKAVGLRKTV